ncbi:hypothetical protein GJ744_000794 [Endocarpon pusillum]|uniref:Uncharacterized protein n=1 Tax=Endocarpon pusillum TaxID=364733 RepID=A0A8H7E8V9_9EURO|nr:hypothetical protein GJ744_000794 [Endocarpon pusillum]
MGQEGLPRRAGRGTENKWVCAFRSLRREQLLNGDGPMQKHSKDDGAIGIGDLAWWPSDCDSVDSCRPRRRLPR